LDHGEEVGGELVVTGGDSAEVQLLSAMKVDDTSILKTGSEPTYR
jgi:hypothetical protein